MKTLIVDMSPILYSNLISASTEMKRNGAKPNENGKLHYDYEDVVIYKIFEELSVLKIKFQANAVVLAFDTPGKTGYWRKQIIFFDSKL